MSTFTLTWVFIVQEDFKRHVKLQQTDPIDSGHFVESVYFHHLRKINKKKSVVRVSEFWFIYLLMFSVTRLHCTQAFGVESWKTFRPAAGSLAVTESLEAKTFSLHECLSLLTSTKRKIQQL